MPTPIEHRTASPTPSPTPSRNLPSLLSILAPTSRDAFCGSPICPSYPLDRLNRHEATLWRQAAQILFALMPWIGRKP